MSLIKNSKHTLSANIINQIFAMILFLSIPNILSQEDYAQTIFISVLLSFMVLSDFGMSFVYSRIMPSIYHDDNKNEIEEFNQTFFWFRITMSIIGSIIISVIYYYKYENSLNSFLLFFLNPLTLTISFFIQKSSVQENFLIYKNINIRNSIMKIVIVPISFLFNTSGWIGGQAFASLIVISSIKQKVILSWDKVNFLLIKSHFFEGLILLANFFFWNQLLNSGRLFSTFSYEDNVIAQYGITNAGYTLLLTLSISIFLPVTVATLKIMKTETKNAIEQLFNIIIKTSLVLFIVVVVAIELAPYLYKLFFPKYNIDFDILKYQLLSLITLPLVATLGNIFIGLKEPLKLMLINGFSFVLTFLVFSLLDIGIISAAISQFIGMMFLGITLLISVVFFYGKFIENRLRQSAIVLFSVFVPYIIYFYIKNIMLR